MASCNFQPGGCLAACPGPGDMAGCPGDISGDISGDIFSSYFGGLGTERNRIVYCVLLTATWPLQLSVRNKNAIKFLGNC